MRTFKQWIIHNVMFRFHKCSYDVKLYDIEMENNTNFLVTQCACGKTNLTEYIGKVLRIESGTNET